MASLVNNFDKVCVSFHFRRNVFLMMVNCFGGGLTSKSEGTFFVARIFDRDSFPNPLELVIELIYRRRMEISSDNHITSYYRGWHISAKYFKSFSQKYAMHLIREWMKLRITIFIYILRYKFSYPVTYHNSFEQTTLYCSSVWKCYFS